jgi:glycerophosphoryl diester phosphodiesterase
VQQRLPSLLDHPIAFAHRGGRAHAPENTLEAFELGLRLGATGLETDVWLTQDGIPVLVHDGAIRSRLRTRRIADLTRSQLPHHVPDLVDLVERCGVEYHLSIDLKDPNSGPAVIRTLHEVAPALVPRTWLCHPDFELLAALRRTDADIRLVNSTRLDRLKDGAERRAALLSQLGIDGINLFHTEWNGGLATLFHRFGRTAFGWGVEYERQFQTVYRMGLDAVYGDWVDRMMDSYRAELGRPAL